MCRTSAARSSSSDVVVVSSIAVAAVFASAGMVVVRVVCMKVFVLVSREVVVAVPGCYIIIMLEWSSGHVRPQLWCRSLSHRYLCANTLAQAEDTLNIFPTIEVLLFALRRDCIEQ
jgi:hypothetical protein